MSSSRPQFTTQRHRPVRAWHACIAAAAVIAVTSCGSAQATTHPVVGPNMPLSDINPPSAAYQEPDLAVDPSHPSNIAVAYNEGSHYLACYLASSSDGGATWTRRTVVGQGGMQSLPQGVTHCQHPKLAYTPSGALVYTFQDSGFRRDEPLSIHVLSMTSSNNGASFLAPQILDPSAVAPNDWYPVPAADRSTGGLDIAWTRYVQNFTVFPGHVVVTSTADGGRTFTPPVTVSPSDQSQSYVGSPVMDVGPDGRMYVSYLPSVSGKFSFAPGALEVAVSGDSGKTFSTSSPASIITGCAAMQTGCTALQPFGEVQSIAAGTKPKTAYLAWWDDSGPGALARISFTSTSDGGSTWAAPAVVGIPAGHAGDQQYHPSLAVAPNGRIDLAYYDLAPDGSQDVYWADSTDGGATFSAPVKGDTRASTIGIGPASGPTGHASYGFYLGLSSADSKADIAWTDSRRGDLNTGHQDVYFASITPGS